MIRVPPIEKVVQKRLRGCIRAYLEGKQSLPWILRVIGNQKTLAAQLLLTEFRGHAHTARYRELKEALETPPEVTGEETQRR